MPRIILTNDWVMSQGKELPIIKQISFFFFFFPCEFTWVASCKYKLGIYPLLCDFYVNKSMLDHYSVEQVKLLRYHRDGRKLPRRMGMPNSLGFPLESDGKRASLSDR